MAATTANRTGPPMIGAHRRRLPVDLSAIAGDHGNRDGGTHRRGVAWTARRHPRSAGRRRPAWRSPAAASAWCPKPSASGCGETRRSVPTARTGAVPKMTTRVTSKPGAASFDRRNAGPDEGRRAAHHQHVARADPAVADSLQRRGRTAHSRPMRTRPTSGRHRSCRRPASPPSESIWGTPQSRPRAARPDRWRARAGASRRAGSAAQAHALTHAWS